jgi:hypothetical protein
LYNKGLTISIIISFLVLAGLPFWYGAFSPGTREIPKLELPPDRKECVEPAQYMRTNHTDLLTTWKEQVVRDGKRTYVSSTGKAYQMGLTNTCMECHANKAKFCDRCHDYMNVKPFCWDCHNIPDEAKK